MLWTQETTRTTRSPSGPSSLERLGPQPASGRAAARSSPNSNCSTTPPSPQLVERGRRDRDPALDGAMALAGGVEEAERRPDRRAPARRARSPRPAGGRRCSACARRTRAGRRSRTGSGSRSWSRPACRDRARSPRRAARRRAPRARRRSSPLPASSSSSASTASKVGSAALRPCAARAGRASACRAGPRRGAGSGPRSCASRPRPASGSRAVQSHGIWTICIRPSPAS